VFFVIIAFFVISSSFFCILNITTNISSALAHYTFPGNHTEAEWEKIEQLFISDRSLLNRYQHWLGNFLKGDFGESYTDYPWLIEAK
jgi:ABC-type dipeptide/oligopeptide/nickel transport system permease component